jgi:hypothetical protein
MYFLSTKLSHNFFRNSYDFLLTKVESGTAVSDAILFHGAGHIGVGAGSVPDVDVGDLVLARIGLQVGGALGSRRGPPGWRSRSQGGQRVRAVDSCARVSHEDVVVSRASWRLDCVNCQKNAQKF